MGADGREIEDEAEDRFGRAATGELPQGAVLEDFWAFLPQHKFFYSKTGELWPGASLDNVLPWVAVPGGKPIRPSAYLDRTRGCSQMVWTPGEPAIIRDKVLDHGGWRSAPGDRLINLYRPPEPQTGGDPLLAGMWVDHIRLIYPDEWKHIIAWCAHRVQRPGEKINHALVLVGNPGIGKDTALEPVKRAIGPWNWCEVTPPQLSQRFNTWARNVVVRVSEARDQGEVDRYNLYNHLKNYLATPPDVLRVDEKHVNEYSVSNVLTMIFTTNYRSDGIYLPPDDRRHFVAGSDLTQADFAPDYWRRLWSWYDCGGFAHVAAYLQNLDIGAFDSKEPPPHTLAFHTIVAAGLSQDDNYISDLLESLGRPAVITVRELQDGAISRQMGEAAEFLSDRRARRALPHVMERAGYVSVPNPNADDRRWKLGRHRETVYGRAELSYRQRTDEIRARWAGT